MQSLFETHAKSIRRFAASLVGVDDADDLTADVFVLALQRAADTPHLDLPWLLVTCRNLAHNRRRKRNSHDAYIEAEAMSATTVQDGFETSVETNVRVHRALQLLPVVEREAFVLHCLEDLSVADACVIADCSPNTFRVRVHRARTRLQTHLQELAPHMNGDTHE